MAWSLRLVEPKRFDAGGFSEGKGNLLTVCAIEYLTMDRSDMDLSPTWMSNGGRFRLVFGEEPQVSGYSMSEFNISAFTIPPLFGPIHYIYLGNHSRLGTAGVIFTYRWDAWSEVGLQVKHIKMQKLIMMNSKSYQGCLKTLTKHVRIPSTPKHRRPSRAFLKQLSVSVILSTSS